MPNLPPTHNPKVHAPTHQAPMQEDNRIRGGKLMRIRERLFKKHPLCVMCLEMKPQRVSQSVEIDHIIPLHLGGTDTDNNRQALCAECHKIKTSGEATDRSRNHGYRKPAQNKPLSPRYTIA